jgi:hypothetical protein
MQGFFNRWLSLAAFVFMLLIAAAHRVEAGDTLTWRTNDNRVNADIQSVPLIRLLEGVAQLTGWRVYLESNTTHTVSAKFQDLPAGEALRHLLGNLNFALVPQSNSSPRLYVFHSSQRNATQLIHPADLNAAQAKAAKVAPNELLVTLKPGAKIESIACLSDATTTGRLGRSNTYRIKWDSAETAQTARECLANDPDVESVESNFIMDRVDPIQRLDANVAPDLNLKIKEQTGDCKVIIALIDTPVGSLGKDLDAFMMPAISVAGEATKPTELTHGSAMAEILLRGIQTTTAGSASPKILPVDIYGNNATTTTADLYQGIYAAINSGANVINLSLGSNGDSAALHSLIKYASEQGIVFFGAAGNEPVTTPVYPAAYPEVIAVTAGDRYGQIASYANRGSFVDIMTPGTSVIPYNGQSYAISGTSAATAFASGLAAGLADSSRNCPSQVIPTLRSKLAVNPGAAP